MTMRDKIASIIADATEDGLDAADVAGAILAALPGMVPDLAWKDEGDGFYRATISEETPREFYEVFGSSAIFYATRHSGGSYILLGDKHSTIEDAKAAANAHHRAAVCKAMGLHMIEAQP